MIDASMQALFFLDRVKIEVSRYDSSKGRIIYRLRNKSYLICSKKLLITSFSSVQKEKITSFS